MPIYTVPASFSPLPLKKFLRQHCGISLSLWRKIKQSGKIERANTLLHPSDILLPGETIQVCWPIECNIVPSDLPLSIAFEDEWLMAVNKSAGMLVHPTVARETETLANAVIHYYNQQHLSLGFHPVHRLDRNTSGLLLIAKQPNIQHQLINAQKNFSRIYLAVCHGHPADMNGTINLPIGRCPDSIIQRQITPHGQTAITHYRQLQKLQNTCLLELELDTGRTHQIRVHLSAIGHPLLGDTLYGSKSPLIQRQALHAARLQFHHPISGQLIVIHSPLPDDMQELIKTLS